MILIAIAGCGGQAELSPGRSPAGVPVRSSASPKPSAAAATESPEAGLTIPPSMAGVAAAAGFEVWLSQPDLEYELGFDGTDAGVVPVHGMIHVDGPDSFQLLTAESGA